MQWLFSSSWFARHRTSWFRRYRYELGLLKPSLLVAWPLVVLCSFPFVSFVSSWPQFFWLVGFGFAASLASFWCAVSVLVRPFGFSKGCSRRRAARKAITAFAPPESLSPWEASALLGTGDVASVWFQEMVDAGALSWSKVSESEDAAEFTLSLGNLSTVDEFSASVLFTVVVPEGTPRLVRMESAHQPECGELPVKFARDPYNRFGGTDFSVTFQIVRDLLAGRLSTLGWFRNFSFPKRRSSGTGLIVGILTLPLSLGFVGFAASNVSPSGSSAVPGVAFAVAALVALFSFPFGYRAAKSVVLLTDAGAEQFIEAESWRRLLVTAIGDRAADAYQMGFGEEDLVPWLSAFGLEELKGVSVRWRNFTPLSLAWEETSLVSPQSYFGPPPTLSSPPARWFKPLDPGSSREVLAARDQEVAAISVASSPSAADSVSSPLAGDPHYRGQLEQELQLLRVLRLIFTPFLSLSAVCAVWVFVFGLDTVPSVLEVPVFWFAETALFLGPMLLFFVVLFSIGIRDRRRRLKES